MNAVKVMLPPVAELPWGNRYQGLYATQTDVCTSAVQSCWARYYESNWFNNSSYTYNDVNVSFQVPVPAAGSPGYASYWTGMDGADATNHSSDVVQADVESPGQYAGCDFWVEDYPNPYSPGVGPSISCGNSVYIDVSYQLGQRSPDRSSDDVGRVTHHVTSTILNVVCLPPAFRSQTDPTGQDLGEKNLLSSKPE